MSELAQMDATAQAELVRRGEVTPAELVAEAIDRIEALNPKINAVITPLFESAREISQQRLPEGPFRGVPFLLKDILASYRGVPLTSGSRFLKDFIPDHDSELVQRFKGAGLIVLGKTNTCELGLYGTTEPELFGPTRNPWNLDKTPGGSSGGSAAAVASGMVPMAHGNDGGGSIRIPASCCGLFGLKPTRARTSLGPDVGDILSGLVVEGALTRSVRDAAALLDAVAGAAPGDPYVAPAPKRSFLEEIQGQPRPFKIAFTSHSPTGCRVHPDCVAAVDQTVQLLEELGHQLEEVDLPADPDFFRGPFRVVWSVGATASVKLSGEKIGRPLDPKKFEAQTWALYEEGLKYSATDYLKAVGEFHRLGRKFARAFEDYDLWLTPTLALPPPRLGTLKGPSEDPGRIYSMGLDFAPFPCLVNVTGQCAMSVPLFWNQEGLPIGSHFIGRYGAEDTLLSLAAQLEQARPWAKRFPPISAF